MAVAASVALITGALVAVLGQPGNAAATVLFNQPFNDNTVHGPAGSVSLPAVLAGTWLPGGTGPAARPTHASRHAADRLISVTVSCRAPADAAGNAKAWNAKAWNAKAWNGQAR
jgi:hypothetical protein